MIPQSAFEAWQNGAGKERNPVHLLWYCMTSVSVDLFCHSCHSVALLLYAAILRHKVRGANEKLSGQWSRPKIRFLRGREHPFRARSSFTYSMRCLSGSDLAFTSHLETRKKGVYRLKLCFLIHYMHQGRSADFIFLIEESGPSSHDSTLGMCERTCFWDLMDDVWPKYFSPLSWSNICWYFRPHVLMIFLVEGDSLP